jgi:hypothetical protein
MGARGRFANERGPLRIVLDQAARESLLLQSAIGRSDHHRTARTPPSD